MWFESSFRTLVVYKVYIAKMICFKIFIDSMRLISNIYIVKILQYTFSAKIIFVIVYILEKLLDKRKKNNQSFAIFVIFGIKQSVGKIEKMPKFRSFQDLF